MPLPNIPYVIKRTDLVVGDTTGTPLSGCSGKANVPHKELQENIVYLYDNRNFERELTVIDPPGTVNYIVWIAPYACTVTAVKGYRVGGTGAVINARKNGTSEHLVSNLSLTSIATWMDGGSVQNTAYIAGDKLEVMIVSAAGSPTQVAVQVNFVRT